MNILFISAHHPSSISLAAGQKTTYSLIESLTDVNVYLVELLNKGDFGPGDLNGLPKNVVFSKKIAFTMLDKILGVFSLFFMGVHYRFATRFKFGLRKTVAEIVRRHNIKKIYLDFSQTHYLSEYLSKKAEIILICHDLQLQLVLRKTILEKLTAGWCFLTEHRFFCFASKAFVQSSKDLDIVKNLYGIEGSNLVLISPKISDFVLKIKREQSKIVPNSFLFWGAMSRKENSDSVLFFYDHVFKKLANEFPNMLLYIVGSSPPPSLLALRAPNVIVTGFIEDPSSFFEKAMYGVAYLKSGAGIKVKVLEMHQAGLPIFANDIALEGIEDRSKITKIDDSNLLDSIRSVLIK